MNSFPFSFGVVTDEIDDDLPRALLVARELGMTHVELNSISGKSVTDLSFDDVRRAQSLLVEQGRRVSAVSTPAFKAVLLDDVPRGGLKHHADFQKHLEICEKGLKLAVQFDAPFVRIFSFRKSGMAGLGNPSPRLPAGGEIPDEYLERIVEGLRIACDLATKAEKTLVLENVRSCWGNTGENAARIIEAVNAPHLKAIWDPGNSYVSGGDPMAGYEVVKPHTVHVHVKDAAVRDAATGQTSWECIGCGEIAYREQFAALLRDGYSGVICLETHWRGEGLSKEESSRQSFAGMMKILSELQRGRRREESAR
jgi:sugar phosphate isomerase/epimerase